MHADMTGYTCEEKTRDQKEAHHHSERLDGTPRNIHRQLAGKIRGRERCVALDEATQQAHSDLGVGVGSRKVRRSVPVVPLRVDVARIQ
jgi:hypothetical protein